MSDKQPSAKFPYIVLPTLSSEGESRRAQSVKISNDAKMEGKSKSATKLPPITTTTTTTARAAPTNSSSSGSVRSRPDNGKSPPQPKPPKRSTQATAISRHLALSKQFGVGVINSSSDESAESGKHVSEGHNQNQNPNQTNARVSATHAMQSALIAQYELRKTQTQKADLNSETNKDVSVSMPKTQPQPTQRPSTPTSTTTTKPSCLTSSSTSTQAHISDLVSASAALSDLSAKTKRTMDALSQIFPHRIGMQNQKQTTTTTTTTTDSNGTKSPKEETVKAAKLSEKLNVNTGRRDAVNIIASLRNSILSKSQSSSSSSPSPVPIPVSNSNANANFKVQASDSGNISNDNLKSRIDGLTVHVRNKDNEVLELKQHVIELQLMLLAEQKQAKCSNDLVERLTDDILKLQKKLGSIEETVEHQESNIINRLMIMDGMDMDSDSDSSECGGVVMDSRARIACGLDPPGPNTYNSRDRTGPTGINALKECMNWIPIAPDFDKLLNAIFLLNYRMDKNQPMKLSKNGNATSFKHADTIPLAIYKNGLVLGSSGFRSFATLPVIKLVNEIFNGFFPSELHAQFPDGVVFVVSDKRSLTHDIRGFNGSGMKLSDSKSVPILLPGTARLRNVRRIEYKVPEKSTSGTAMGIYDTDASLALSSTITLPDILAAFHNANYEKLISLKLKNIDDGKTYRFKVSTSSTIDDILLHLEHHLLTVHPHPGSGEGENDSGRKAKADKLRKEIKEKLELEKLENAVAVAVTATDPQSPSESPSKFDIILPFPHGILTSGNSTLKEYGLVTNTFLYFKPSDKESLLPLPSSELSK